MFQKRLLKHILGLLRLWTHRQKDRLRLNGNLTRRDQMRISGILTRRERIPDLVRRARRRQLGREIVNLSTIRTMNIGG